MGNAGIPLRSAPNEKRFKDSNGNVSTESVTFVIEGPALDLETKEMFVPYSAFNFKPSGGGHICYVAVRAEIFIDGLVVGSSEVAPFNFRY